MKNNKHNIVIFISNPFGFGPTGKILPLIQELRDKWTGKIIYGASAICLEPVPKLLASKIEIVKLDERNKIQLKAFLKRYENPLVVICLNKAAIKTAKALNLNSIFIDDLTWLWKKVPKDYLLADTYYCFDIFNTRNKIKSTKNAKIVPLVLGSLPKPRKTREHFTLVHLGGYSNPFLKSFPITYLKILSKSLNQLKHKRIVVTGGSLAIKQLFHLNRNKNIKFAVMPRDVFLNNLAKTDHFITTPGLSATIEAFALKTPVSFLLPTNLSQWKQLRWFKKLGVAPSKMEWENYIKYSWSFDKASEKKAAPFFDTLAVKVQKNPNSLKKLEQDMQDMFMDPPNGITQSSFLENIGINGAQLVVRDFIKTLSKD